jgi:hypothetical protein
MSPRARHHAELLAGVANQGSFRPTSELLAGLEGERIISLPEAARLNGTSVDTLKRRHSDKIVKMSDKRVGMRLKHALTLAQPLNATV